MAGVLAACGRIDFDSYDAAGPDAEASARWSVHFGTAARTKLVSMVVDTNDDVYIAVAYVGSITIGVNTFRQPTETGKGVAIAKLAGETGAPIWSRSLGDEVSMGFQPIAMAADGSVWVTLYGEQSLDLGAGSVPVNGFPDAGVMKLGPDNSVRVGLQFGDVNSSLGAAIVGTPDGGAYAAGFFNGLIDLGAPCNALSSPNQIIYLAQFAATGSCVWARKYDGPGQHIPSGIAYHPGTDRIVLTGAFFGSLILGGTAAQLDNPGIKHDDFVATLDGAGNAISAATLGAPSDLTSFVIPTLEADGSVLLGGSTDGILPADTISQPGGRDLVVQLASRVTGRFGGSANDYGRVLALPSGDRALVGRFDGIAQFGGRTFTPSGMSDGVLARIDDGASLRDVEIVKGDGDESSDALALMSDRTRVIAGTFNGTLDLGAGAMISSIPAGVPSLGDLYLARLPPWP